MEVDGYLRQNQLHCRVLAQAEAHPFVLQELVVTVEVLTASLHLQYEFIALLHLNGKLIVFFHASIYVSDELFGACYEGLSPLDH